jgi:hypothetical protein
MGLLTFGLNVTLDGCCDHLVLHPVLAGHGPTLFQGLEPSRHLDLVSTKRLKSGALALHYRRKAG